MSRLPEFRKSEIAWERKRQNRGFCNIANLVGRPLASVRYPGAFAVTVPFVKTRAAKVSIREAIIETSSTVLHAVLGQYDNHLWSLR